MSSTIKVDNVVNQSGDNDSGLDLSTNDQIILKTANTTAITVDSSQNVTLAGNLTVTGTATGTSVGDNQSWTDVTSSRSSNTVYTNSTGRPIMVSVGLEIAIGGATVNWFYVGSVIVAMIQNTSAELATTTSFIVPNGATYKHQYQSVAPTIRNWSELS